MELEYGQSRVRIYETVDDAFRATMILMKDKIGGIINPLGPRFEVTVDVRNLAYAMSILR